MKCKLYFFILLFGIGCLQPVFAINDSIPVAAAKDSLKFYNGQDFTVIGKFHDEKNYARFPERYKNVVRKEVWDLGQNSAGLGIRFRTNASDISIRWSLLDDNAFPHMALTGIKGVDLYVMMDGAWRFVQTGRPGKKTSEYVMFEKGEPAYREYLLNLPLYDGIESIYIGVNADAEISKPVAPWLTVKKPVVYYGSSIAQGGCASRPGMAFTNILARKLDRTFINMGFSGSGTFDSSVAVAMCEADAALYVVDCNPNTETRLIYDRALKLVQQLKQCKPNVPVLLEENFLYENSFLMKDKQADNETKRKELRRAFATLTAAGLKNIYYQKSDGMLGTDHEGAVDGVHPTDLGMLRIADFQLPVIKNILAKTR